MMSLNRRDRDGHLPGVSDMRSGQWCDTPCLGDARTKYPRSTIVYEIAEVLCQDVLLRCRCGEVDETRRWWIDTEMCWVLWRQQRMGHRDALSNQIMMSQTRICWDKKRREWHVWKGVEQRQRQRQRQRRHNNQMERVRAKEQSNHKGCGRWATTRTYMGRWRMRRRQGIG